MFMYQINQNSCVCCHNCAMECPRQAIRYLGSKYQIDPDKCIECGLCERLCHAGAISDVDHPGRAASHGPVEKSADLVVCGGGTGLVAAVRAAQTGKHVILVEKAEKLGGNTDYAHNFFPVYTKWHEEAGMPDMREEAVRHYREETDNVIEEDVLRTAVYGAGEFFDWLCELGTPQEVYRLVRLGDADAHGPVYGPGVLDLPRRNHDNLNCRDDAIGPGWGGTYIKYAMLDAIEQQRLNVEILVGTAARHLQLDEKGSICGVICEDAGGEVRIACRSVVLATGGFGRSDGKLRKYAPEFFAGEPEPHRFSVPTDTGDSIDMLEELGVEPDPERMYISLFGPKHHPFSNVLAEIALVPEMPQFNCEGRRWVNENVGPHGMTPVLKKQPKLYSWAIQSRDEYRRIAERFISDPAFASSRNFYETWEEDIREEAALPQNPPVRISDTLEGLAVSCGMPVEIFVNSVRRYNEFCAGGVDRDFGKPAEFLRPIPEKGPYYAVYESRFSEAAMGGVRVNGACQVLRNDGTPIPGLYAGGDCTSAMHRKGKLAVVSELTWAVASNFTAGGNASDYLERL